MDRFHGFRFLRNKNTKKKLFLHLFEEMSMFIINHSSLFNSHAFRLKSRSLLVIGMLAVSACIKDPVPTEESAWDVEMSAMYEQLGIIDDVRTGLASGDYFLVDSLLVYDGLGNLIVRQGMQSGAIDRKSMTVRDLAEGVYTFVLFQACCHAGEPGRWTSVDAGQLSTLQIRYSDACVEGVQALGVAKELVTIGKGAKGAALTPRAAGGIVDFQIDGYAKEKGTGEGMFQKLPPIWLYCADHVAGLYPDSGQYLVFPEKNAIGCLEEGQLHRKFFILTDGSEVSASVQADNGFIYYQDTISLSPGTNAVCYLNFAPKTFFNACWGTPEGADAFKAGHAEDSCTLYPFLQWGGSRDDVDKYVKNRTALPCGDGGLSFFDGITAVQYNPAPGLAEICYFDSFDSAGKLVQVTYTYDGLVKMNIVQSCMEKMGFKYMGYFVVDYVFMYYLYLSADGQTEFVIHLTSDTLPAAGYERWAATFIPFNPDDLTLLE